jgi:hypothetical protein
VIFVRYPIVTSPLGRRWWGSGGVAEVDGTYTLSLTGSSDYLDIYVLSSFLQDIYIRVSK